MFLHVLIGLDRRVCMPAACQAVHIKRQLTVII
jgi:hypothetical protein